MVAELGLESELVVGCCGCAVPTVVCEPVRFCVCWASPAGGVGVIVRLGMVVLCGVNGELDVGCDGDFLLAALDWESLSGCGLLCVDWVCRPAESTRKTNVARPAMTNPRLADFADA